MPTLGQSNSSIYGDIQLPKLLSITGPQSLGRASAGPNAAMTKLAIEQQDKQQIQQLASEYLSDPDNPDYDGFVKARARFDPDGAFANGKALDDWRISTAKKDSEESAANAARLMAAASELQPAVEDPTLYTPEFRNAYVQKHGPLADKALPQVGDPDAPNKLVGVMTAALPLQEYLKKRSEYAAQFADGKKVEGTLGLLSISNTPELWASNSRQVTAMGMKPLLEGVTSPEIAADRLKAYQAQQPQKAGESAKVGSFEDYVTRTYGANPTPANILAARKAYQQADDRPRVSVSVAGQGVSDVKESVAGMKDGTVPPQLPGRASKDYTAIMAEAHRQGFNLVKANEDWVATQKYLATLNGQQQTRLRQAVEQVQESVPLVRSLVKEWDSSGLPVLSAGNLAAAASGAYGQKQQSLARRLKAQIADMTSELGTVYKGGNSSTDESLKLAAENLAADWGKQTALDALNQIEMNIRFRKNSMKLGPVTNENNQYAPNLGGPAPKRQNWVFDSKGQLVPQ